MPKIKIPWAYPDIGQKELNEILNSFQSGWLTMGPKVTQLENKFSSFLNAPYSVAVSNGTVALDLSLKALGVGPGDEVIVPALSFFATASAVNYQSAIPVFVDVDKNTFNLNPKCIGEAITKKTKAIIFIDYGGNPADFDELKKVGQRYGVPLIQDSAQSLGGIYKGKPMGAQAPIATMSFHMAKGMTTIEGGMIFCRRYKIYNDLVSRRNHGEHRSKKYHHIVLGTNARMTDLQAGIGLAQFKQLSKFIEQRKKIASHYNDIFSCNNAEIQVAQTPYPNSSNAYFFYPILIENRNKIAKKLLEKYGIDTRIAYPMPLWKQRIYVEQKQPFRRMECPVTEYVTSRILNLPIYPSMTQKMVEFVGKAVLKEM